MVFFYSAKLISSSCSYGLVMKTLQKIYSFDELIKDKLLIKKLSK